MSPRIASAVACLLATTALPSPALSFAPTSSSFTSSSSSSSSSTSSALQMSSSAQHTSEEMYPRLLNSASLCANSDTCSIENAESYLREIVHVQSGCAAGTLSGNKVCNDVLSVSDVVANLRRKIDKGTKKEARTFWDDRQEEWMTLLATNASFDIDENSSTSTAMPAVLRAPLKPAYLAIAALYTIAVIAMVQHHASVDVSAGGVVSFTAQEIWWAVRDGYIGDLTSHAFRHGGLVVSDASAVVGSSLSPQELMSSVRDGYASDTLFASGGSGSGGGGGGGIESVPFTPQEVMWAIQHGYSYNMVERWIRHGGLSV